MIISDIHKLKPEDCDIVYEIDEITADGVGIFVTFNSGAIMQLIGWMMILTGVIGVIGDVMFIQHMNGLVEKLTKE